MRIPLLILSLLILLTIPESGSAEACDLIKKKIVVLEGKVVRFNTVISIFHSGACQETRLYDIQSSEKKIITRHLVAYGAVEVSPDKSKILFSDYVPKDEGKRSVAYRAVVYDLATGTMQIVYSGEDQLTEWRWKDNASISYCQLPVFAKSSICHDSPLINAVAQ